jgi:hypothetical protein
MVGEVIRVAIAIGDAIEATLAVAWYPIALLGVLLGVFVSAAFYGVILVGVPGDWLLLRRRVARRLQIRPEDRKMLWLWTSYRGFYWGIR